MLNVFKVAINGLLSNKTRTGLTMLGVIIGISAVVIIMGAGDGLKGLILGQIEGFGTNIIETEIKVPISKAGKGEAYSETQGGISLAMGVIITTLTTDDMKDINDLDNIKTSYAGMMGQEQVSYSSELRKAMLYGVSSTYLDIDESEIDYGRFFDKYEEKSLSNVVVLGSEIKEELFGDSNPIGKNIKIRKRNFKVIGVMKERGSFSVLNFDDYIYVPLKTLQKRVLGINYVSYMIHKVIDMDYADQTADDIRGILRENHNISDPVKDDFRVVTMDEMLDMLDTVTSVITLLLLAIVAISLLVGGVGIMNTMLVVISERTKEIGLRKAVGATNSNILRQFLVESIIITFIGAVLGVLLGLLISYIISVIASFYFDLNWGFSINTTSVVIAFTFSLILGLIFGVYPAKRASKMNPIDALRKE